MTSRHTSANGPSIVFEGLGLKLGGQPILQDITFSVVPGSIHCILGPNGGGKTSLLRSLLGQMPHSGSIRITWPNSRQVTGYVPQAMDFDRTLPLTVADFMDMICRTMPVFLGSAGGGRASIRRALERVGMAHKAEFRFGGLSGGECRRVLLAQGLLPQPNLLVLDEPASGLDKEGAEIMRAILRDLQNQGTTILMIHHDLAEVRTMADMVTCINKTVLFSGTPQEVLTPETTLTIFSSTNPV